MRRDRFYYTNEDKRGLVVLLVLIVVLAGGLFFLNRLQHGDNPSSDCDSLLTEYLAFRSKLKDRETADSLERAGRRKYMKRAKYDIATVVPSAFAPNTDDSAGLVRAGLPTYVARNIIRYRAKGGRFRKPEDVSRIYGMTDEIYRKMFPYIVIEEDSVVVKDTAKYKPFYPIVEKYEKGTVVDINLADTSELKKIPGIGSAYSAMIVAYRSRLGGYVSVGQIREIAGLPSGLEVWFSVNSDFKPHKININRASIERLRAHPYMGFYRARAIVEYRRKYGRIDNFDKLGMLEEFGDGFLERLKPYLEL